MTVPDPATLAAQAARLGSVLDDAQVAAMHAAVAAVEPTTARLRGPAVPRGRPAVRPAAPARRHDPG